MDAKFPVEKYERKLDDEALDEIFDAVVDKKASGRMKKGDAALLKQLASYRALRAC